MSHEHKETNGHPKPPKDLQDEVFRLATNKDIPKLLYLINSTYRGEEAKKSWTTEASILGGQRADASMLQAEIESETSCILILESEAKGLLGCVNLRLEVETKHCYLGLLTVSLNIQSQGTGRRILYLAEEWAQKNWQSPKVWMTVIDSRSELISWYVRRGYTNTHQKSEFPTHDPRYGIPLVSKIQFVLLEKTL